MNLKNWARLDRVVLILCIIAGLAGGAWLIRSNTMYNTSSEQTDKQIDDMEEMKK